jgi:hypothetical protein
MKPDQLLTAAAATFAERSKLYGDNYKRFPTVFLSLFPGGVLPPIKTAGDMSRLQLMMQITNKLTRYAENLTRGGHQDSAHDIIVYAAMLEEETNEQNSDHRA